MWRLRQARWWLVAFGVTIGAYLADVVYYDSLTPVPHVCGVSSYSDAEWQRLNHSHIQALEFLATICAVGAVISIGGAVTGFTWPRRLAFGALALLSIVGVLGALFGVAWQGRPPICP
jgi:hypothetical protein